MQAQKLEYTQEIARETESVFEKLRRFYTAEHWKTIAPYISEINRLKKEKNAVLLAHNYMTPDIFYGVGDITGDSLKLAQEAAKSEADIIIQCGVHFMAETSKILCPDKKIIIPDLDAGCSLAESVTGADIRKLKEQYPGIPVVSYVNTSADVKAETDVCCTSSNALHIIEALGREGHDTVIMTPDKFLAANVAVQTDIKIIIWDGVCIVHERFSQQDVADLRAQNEGILVLAHPECSPEVVKMCDYSGSTSQMDNFIKEHKPAKAALMTECSMSDNIAMSNPEVEMVGTCQMCPYMKRITLPKILNALRSEDPEVKIDLEIAIRARRSVERMLEMS